MTTTHAPRVTALVHYAAAFAEHAPVNATDCSCGRVFGSRLGLGNHARAAVRRAAASLSVEQSRILADLRAATPSAGARWYAEQAVAVEQAATLDLTPAAIVAVVHDAGATNATATAHREGVVLVAINAAGPSAADAERLRRLVSAALLQAGYDTVARGTGELLVLLPEPEAVEETVAAELSDAPEVVEFRQVGRGLAEVVRNGVAAGRVKYDAAYWWGYDLTGEKRTGGYGTARLAAAALAEAAPGITPDAPAGRVAPRQEDAVEAPAPATVERYRAPSGNRDEDRFRAVHPACGWRSPAWHSNRTVEGRSLAERDAREHRCAEPAVDDDPREQPASFAWSEHAGS